MGKTCLYPPHTSTLALPLSQARFVSFQRVTKLSFIACFSLTCPCKRKKNAFGNHSFDSAGQNLVKFLPFPLP